MTIPTGSRVRSELNAQGGLLGALVALADEVRSSAQALASAIEGVALEIDRERRGSLSISGRQDQVEVTATIQRLLQDPLLGPEGQSAVAQEVLHALIDSPRSTSRAPRRAKMGRTR